MKYNDKAGEMLEGKAHVVDGVGAEQFLEYIFIASGVFFLISISMIVYMICKRKYEIKKKINTTKLVEKYQDFLSSFLILPVDTAFLGIQKSNELEYRLDREDITKPKRRMILAKEIYHLKKDLMGQQEVQLSNYFFGLGLQSEVIRLLKSFSWTDKVFAMQMVESFSIIECLPMINSYVNHKNRELAIHAILIRMNLDKSIAVLKEIDVPLNDWDCHKIVSRMKRLHLTDQAREELKVMTNDTLSPLYRLRKGLIEEKQVSFGAYQIA